MTLQDYATRFRRLNVNRQRDHSSPHKVCMLLAAMDLIESGHITTNRIELNEKLVEKFTHHFDMLRSGTDQPTSHLPYYHLRSDGFWHHRVRPGHDVEYEDLTRSVSHKRVKEAIEYAYLDDSLFEFMKYAATRELLKYELFENVDVSGRQDFRDAMGGWTELECELIVSDYLNMFLKELRRETYSKAEHRRALLPHLDNRTEGSIEYKHQNISAILIDLGLPYIQGYKPAFNYQKLLRDVVTAHVQGRNSQIEVETTAAILPAPEPIPVLHWSQILDEPPQLTRSEEFNQREFTPRIYNYAEREQRSRILGVRGEEFVLTFERQRLAAMGRADLAKEIEWTSKERGDGAGYDVRSFHGDRDEELYIEVKTTNSGKYQPFLISDNEVAFSEEHSARYALYRVFDFRQKARLFMLPGSIRQHVNLAARQYQASFR